jgi:hypothetical protein
MMQKAKFPHKFHKSSFYSRTFCRVFVKKGWYQYFQLDQFNQDGTSRSHVPVSYVRHRRTAMERAKKRDVLVKTRVNTSTSPHELARAWWARFKATTLALRKSIEVIRRRNAAKRASQGNRSCTIVPCGPVRRDPFDPFVDRSSPCAASPEYKTAFHNDPVFYIPVADDHALDSLHPGCL